MNAPDIELRPFQRRFIRRAFAPDVRTAALSLPRGNGKSTLAGVLASQATESLGAGEEAVVVASSLEQGRIVFRFVRERLEPSGSYRFADSISRVSATHKRTGARLRVIASNGKTAMGLVNTPIVIADEPGAWATTGGELLHAAIQTAQGKPNSPLRAVYVGTLAPATAGWWHDMVAAGSGGSTHVTHLAGERATWDKWPTIRRCNPLMSLFAESRAVLLEERGKARLDTSLKAQFMSYRLNLPSGDEASMLLDAADWERVLTRDAPPREGRPIVGVDLGQGRSWSAAVALWTNGRAEALALAPGVPSIAEQERRDTVPRDTYARLVDNGSLLPVDGLRVPPASALIGWLVDEWGMPLQIHCDRFRLADLYDAGAVEVYPRMTRWSESSEDIRALRKAAKDEGLAVARQSRGLLTASMSAAHVLNDRSGNVRMVKRGTNQKARDDVAAALVLAAGAMQRYRAEYRRLAQAEVLYL